MVAEVLERCGDVAVKIVPPQAKVLVTTHGDHVLLTAGPGVAWRGAGVVMDAGREEREDKDQ